MDRPRLPLTPLIVALTLLALIIIAAVSQRAISIHGWQGAGIDFYSPEVEPNDGPKATRSAGPATDPRNRERRHSDDPTKLGGPAQPNQRRSDFAASHSSAAR